MNEFYIKDHIFYVDGSSFMCKFCCKGFSVYDVKEEELLFIKNNWECVNNLNIRKIQINKHEFILDKKLRKYNCKYCYNYMFLKYYDLNDNESFPNCISDEEKIIKELLE